MPDTVPSFRTRSFDPAGDGVIKLAVLAVGGQGGGVLADWVVVVAEKSGYIAQSTSVAGVAQRTGATIYYVEMCRDTGRLPVFALSPSQGDVDILIAAELMEAGRAIMRGFVTPERTTLIASSHRIAAVSEKIEPGDGRASSQKVHATAEAASKRFIAFDMEKIAVANGSMISASLLGALAGSGVLPFARETYEETIRASGRGVKASLAAFGEAYDRVQGGIASSPRVVTPGGIRDEAAKHSPVSSASAAEPLKGKTGAGAVGSVNGPPPMLADWQTLTVRVENYPEPVRDMALRGLKKIVDYQDIAYGKDYLDRLDKAVFPDSAEFGYALSIAAAKHLSNAMCYDDMIRVADLKTRSTRDARVRREVGLAGDSILRTTEYFHPRIEEFCGTLPARLGRFIEDRPKFSAFLDRRINRGRRIRTDSFSGFVTLWLIGGLRRWRRGLLRHQVEVAHLERWYSLALGHVGQDYMLAVEILNCRRLIKGYSDTHVRAQSKFDRVLSGLELVKGREDAADWIRRLREAALKDEKGDLLDGALRTVASLQGSENLIVRPRNCPSRRHDQQQIGKKDDKMDEAGKHGRPARPEAHDADRQRKHKQHRIGRSRARVRLLPVMMLTRPIAGIVMPIVAQAEPSAILRPRCSSFRIDARIAAKASGISTKVAMNRPTMASAWVTWSSCSPFSMAPAICSVKSTMPASPRNNSTTCVPVLAPSIVCSACSFVSCSMKSSRWRTVWVKTKAP